MKHLQEKMDCAIIFILSTSHWPACSVASEARQGEGGGEEAGYFPKRSDAKNGGGGRRRMSVTADGGGGGIGRSSLLRWTDGRIVPLSSLSTFSHKDDRSRIKCHVLRFHLKDVLRHIARGKDFNC